MKQTDKILAALERAGAFGLTADEIRESCGSARAAARIDELRKAGHSIETKRERTQGGAQIARYVLHPTDQLFAAPSIDPRPSSAHYITEAA